MMRVEGCAVHDARCMLQVARCVLRGGGGALGLDPAAVHLLPDGGFGRPLELELEPERGARA
jgi:hypothetical protein